MRRAAGFILLAGVFGELFLEYFHTITAMSQDLGRHLLTGEIILKTHSVPKINLFSYTFPNFPFINHHWFSEVIFYGIKTIFGLNILLIFSILLVFFAFSLVFFYKYPNKNIFALTIVSVLFIPMLFERTDIRPEIFSYVFVSVYAVILYTYRQKFTPLIFFILPIQLAWANMHIYFAVGVLVTGLFLLEELVYERKKLFMFLKHMLSNNKNLPINIHHTLILFIVFISSILVTFINPNGISGALYPLQVFGNYGYQIEENQNIFFLQTHYPRASIIYFEISVVTMLVCFIIMWRRTKLIDWLLFLVFTIMGAMAVRNIALYVFTMFIPFSEKVTLIFGSLESKTKIRKIYQLLPFSILSIILIVQILYTTENKVFGFGQETGASRALDFYIKNKLKGPIFNNFDIGSYIEYRLYPKERVFVDGRPEAYPANFFPDIYIPMQNDKRIFSDVSEKYKFNTIIFSYTDMTPWAHQFIQLIANNPDWKVVYIDDFIIIFVKNSLHNENIISKFGMDQDNVNVMSFEGKNFKSLSYLGYLFNTLGWSKQEELVYKKILFSDESNCFALYNLTILYYKENNPAKNIFGQKTISLCPQYVKFQ